MKIFYTFLSLVCGLSLGFSYLPLYAGFNIVKTAAIGGLEAAALTSDLVALRKYRQGQERSFYALRSTGALCEGLATFFATSPAPNGTYLTDANQLLRRIKICRAGLHCIANGVKFLKSTNHASSNPPQLNSQAVQALRRALLAKYTCHASTLMLQSSSASLAQSLNVLLHSVELHQSAQAAQRATTVFGTQVTGVDSRIEEILTLIGTQIYEFSFTQHRRQANTTPFIQRSHVRPSSSSPQPSTTLPNQPINVNDPCVICQTEEISLDSYNRARQEQHIQTGGVREWNNNGTAMILLECGHAHCKSCLGQWLQTADTYGNRGNKKCPLCNTLISSALYSYLGMRRP